jgi:hypothetical protein
MCPRGVMKRPMSRGRPWKSAWEHVKVKIVEVSGRPRRHETANESWNWPWDAGIIECRSRETELTLRCWRAEMLRNTFFLYSYNLNKTFFIDQLSSILCFIGAERSDREAPQPSSLIHTQSALTPSHTDQHTQIRLTIHSHKGSEIHLHMFNLRILACIRCRFFL